MVFVYNKYQNDTTLYKSFNLNIATRDIENQ